MTAVEIVEVSPRDGLQNEKRVLSTADKVALIDSAVAAGTRRIEVASFVHPKRVPQMADAEDLCAALPRKMSATTIGLVLNRRGAERALATRVDELGAVACASDGFGMANQGRTAEQTVDDAIEVMDMARAAGRCTQVTISVAFGCPFDGEVAVERVVALARRLAQAQPREIAFGDTIGVATPAHVTSLVSALRLAVPGIPLRMHFHDTRGTAIANAWASLQAGVRVLDASIGGCGGCPYAPGASGNVATEDLLYMLGRTGFSTGIDLELTKQAVPWLEARIGRELPGRQAKVARFPA
ncbi:hydroxymethylglutaryl-CoA lyase [Aurantiacibacter xanthus]|uniref:Hydroxymethylglutaryl-CoA lyase n=1 Tax=Aurantiacibacter xanthus TaxID=1784712 RepID=A0A3A1P319_9SPHN|nr:hydroxymethylglutaryl-CoA lyase [Aurantiacibacter xanthus]RIV80103.1 hydroxymethylglutaryl-CoA lyase [Aurantiacibacter xanthus]